MTGFEIPLDTKQPRQALRLSIKNPFKEVKPGPSHGFSFIMSVNILREVLKICFFEVQA